LHRAFLPGEWHMFHPTWVDVLTFVGSCGVFLTLFLLFLRFLPVFPIAEVKAVTPQADPHGGPGHGTGDAFQGFTVAAKEGHGWLSATTGHSCGRRRRSSRPRRASPSTA